MIIESRREFLAAGVVAAGSLFRGASFAAARKMKMCLNTGNIGVSANLTRQIELAAQYGFEAVDPNVNELAKLSDSEMSRVFDDLAAKKLVFGSVAQGVQVAAPDEKWAAYLQTLTATAKTLQRAKITRYCTWISSSDNRLTYLQNSRLHARRISEAVTVLGDHGISFGLEYLGPKTAWARGKYPFIHTMESMKELIAETKKTNLGFLLDSWHWYNAQDTPADILTLKNSDVVAVHLNDAPAGVPLDQQNDGRREIPLATGVIDAAGFLNTLNEIGYDGPIAAEPNNAELRKIAKEKPEEALTAIADAMKRAMALIK